MPIDSYSFCPCGSGKKIKFCCSDLLADLKTLDKMKAGSQFKAALQHIESVESGKKPRACLLASKIEMLRELGRDEEANEAAELFVEHYPDNPLALSEAAIVAATRGEGARGLDLIQQALSQCPELINWQTYDAMTVVAQMLAVSGELRAARALWRLQLTIQSDDEQCRHALAKACFSSAEPLLLKDEPLLEGCPDDAEWKNRFDEAMQPLDRACWSEAAANLDKLANEGVSSPVVWRNLAVLHGWLADRVGSREAFDRLATLDIPLEDAVEAKANAMLLAEIPLEDEIAGVRLTFSVDNADELAGHLALAKHFEAVRFDPDMFEGEEVPPKGVFLLLDRPVPTETDKLTLDTAPNVLGQVFLFGRQTDREARLVVAGVVSTQRELVERLVASVGNGQVAEHAESEVVGSLAATMTLLAQRWHLPFATPKATIRGLIAQHIERVVLEQWPELKLGVLGNESAAEAAGDPDKRIALMSAVLVLQNLLWRTGEPFDFDRLREKLGLPLLGSIDPRTEPIEQIPLVRLHRVLVEELPDESLVEAVRRASAFGAREAASRLGKELIERPSIDGEVKQRVLAATLLIATDFEEKLDCVERGRQIAESKGESSAMWDLREMEISMAHDEIERSQEIFAHIMKEHSREPGVAEGIRRLFLQAGLIDEQGRMRHVAEMPTADEPDETAAEPAAGLWTPDAEKSSSDSTPGKLWTPDMD